MDIWKSNKWKNLIDSDNDNRRTGMRLVFDRDVDPEVRRACKDFGKWLRSKYYFPIRVPVYVKSSERVRARDGDLVCGTFLKTYSFGDEPYARIAAGDYLCLAGKWGKDDALETILHCIAHELTHYFQWLNGIELTFIGEERQATRYANMLLKEYLKTREHV